MPLKPHVPCSRRALPALTAVVAAALATLLSACATEALRPTAPQGVDLSGEWKLNLNLSDDATKLGEEQKEQNGPLPQRSRGRGGGGPGGFGKPGTGGPGGLGGGGPGSIDPGDPTSKNEAPDSGLMPVLFTQADTTLPSSSSDSSAPTAPAAGAGSHTHDNVVAQMLAAPDRLTISQSGAKIIVKSNGGAIDEYTAGEKATIPFGTTEADRTAGWRESYFVVITKAKKGPSKEDDFAIDEEGHLIFATLVTHAKKGNADYKRVYDRVRTPRN